MLLLVKDPPWVKDLLVVLQELVSASWIIDDFCEDCEDCTPTRVLELLMIFLKIHRKASLSQGSPITASHILSEHTRNRREASFQKMCFLSEGLMLNISFRCGGGLDKATQDLYDLKGWWLGDYLDYIIYNLQFAEISPSYLNVKVKAKLPKTKKLFPLECSLVLVVLCGCEKEQNRQKD